MRSLRLMRPPVVRAGLLLLATAAALSTVLLLAQQAIPAVHASQGFQRHLAGVLTRRALSCAAQRARSEQPTIGGGSHGA